MGLQMAMSAAEQLSQNSLENPTQQQMLMSALGLDVEFGALLPFSRSHETEADLFDLDLMAKAGFDPRESVQLWRNMNAASGAQSQPEFMSTHPEPENRIARLTQRLPQAIQLVAQSGKQTRCY
jgi:predicted Zn-dependent protease